LFLKVIRKSERYSDWRLTAYGQHPTSVPGWYSADRGGVISRMLTAERKIPNSLILRTKYLIFVMFTTNKTFVRVLLEALYSLTKGENNSGKS